VAIYVDDMFRRRLGRLGRMRMSHMAADTPAELHAFARRLGLRREWFDRDHYDVCKSMRAEAIRLGAVAISLRDMAAKLRGRG
jgi:hypothetical protein